MGRPRSDRQCQLPGCAGKHFGKGYCHTHYQRLYRYGTIDAAPRLRSTQARLDFYTSKEPHELGCWEWKGYISQAGYGEITGEGGGKALAHRVSYEAYKGQIPDGLVLDHLCRNTRCVNPAHLEAVTQKVNVDRGSQTFAFHDMVCRAGLHDVSLPGALAPNGPGRLICRECRDERQRRTRGRASHV